ncbi:MAG: hypothetical protein WD738_01000 [Pirellulales bacterium]
MKRLLLILIVGFVGTQAFAAYPPHLQARRLALKARKAEQKKAMYEFKAREYQDWHERYLADTPVREQYYRALANRYELEASVYRAPSMYFWRRDYWPIVPDYGFGVWRPAYFAVYYGPAHDYRYPFMFGW